LLVADLLACGSLFLAAFPEALTASSGKIGHRLAAYSCGGSRGITRKICARTAFPFDPLREPPLAIVKTSAKTVKRIQLATNLEPLQRSEVDRLVAIERATDRRQRIFQAC
jgi:hypothetical protein